MAFKFQSDVTSSMTSVTEEEDVSLSESDTTETTDSKSSLLITSTDCCLDDKNYSTDDKLTPCLNSISISKGSRKKTKSSIQEDDNISIKSEESRYLFAQPFAVDPLPHKRNVLSSRHGKRHQKNKRRRDILHSQCIGQDFSTSREDGQNNNWNTFMYDSPDYHLYTDFSTNSFSQSGNPRFNMYDTDNKDDEDDEDDDREDSEDVTTTSDEAERSYLPDMTSPFWYTARVFDNYWKYHNFAMEWYREHKRFMQFQHQQSLNTMFNAPRFPTYCPPPVHKSRRSKEKKRKKRAKNRRAAKAKQKMKSDCEEQIPDDDEEEEETIEMEITEDMINFFSQSHKHRMERDKLKQSNVDQEEVRIDLEKVIPGLQTPSTAAPEERPGVKRTAEMKLLYGRGAPMIHGMETAIQMTFDKFVDKYQPKLWPNMPLKMSFA